VETALEELRAKVMAYEAPKRAPEVAPPKGMIQLGKKTADGVTRIKSKSTEAAAPADAE